MLERGVRKAAAIKFVERWQQEEGREKSQARSFWIELLQEVLGFESPTKMLDFEKRVREREIDVYCEEYGVLIEHKSRGIDLFEKRDNGKYGKETTYEQARWYQTFMSKKPRWIITCNFDSFYIYDLHSGDSIPYEKEYTAKLALEELPEKYDVFDQIFDKNTTRLAIETNISVKTTELIHKMYDALMKQYKNIETNKKEQHDLNVLIVRLVFLLYAENAEILQKDRAFYKYLQPYIKLGKECGGDYLQNALINLFKILDTKVEERGYVSKDLENFPYINGGLFSEEIVIPQFTEEITDLLEKASTKYNWRDISPTIFGATFESTLNPETRRKGGMHYTSIENIHKVIDPLFLDDLKKELARIEAIKVQRDRIRDLKQYIKKLSQLTFLDPACGSGNFLTETYLCLRNLENQALRVLVYEDKYYKNYTDRSIFLGDVAWQYGQNVSINQFYGIEINDFAVAVAKTALWIAEIQANAQTEELLDYSLHVFPLASNNNIHCANALRIDWNDAIPVENCNYIIGNPPFVGHQERSKIQAEDMAIAFYDLKKHGKLDYVCAWYAKALHYINGAKTKCALVSTNSIVQGESVGLLFPYIFGLGGYIVFAYKTFDWASNSLSEAIVDCVIIGFSMDEADDNPRSIYFSDGSVMKANNINGYLCDAPNIYIQSRQGNVNKEAPEIMKGSQPTFCGRGVNNPASLYLTEREREDFICKYPELADCVRQFTGADEYIKGNMRYVFWFDGINEDRFTNNPVIRPLLDKIAMQRKLSPTKDVSENWSKRPYLFTQIRQPKTEYLIIPSHSSEKRLYIPIGFLTPDIIVGNAAQIVPNANYYVFGLITSLMHMAWMRAICGRLESRYRYTPTVFNTFVWPHSTPPQREAIEKCAKAVLDARKNHPNESLANLYDPRKMPFDLLTAHEKLDKAVERAYGVRFNGDEEKIVNHLFKLYTEVTKQT